MLCTAIKGPSFEEAAQQIMSLPFGVDLLEFRLDCFNDLNEAFLVKLRDIRPLPVIFTLRDPRQGSDYKGTETERLRDLQRYAALNPDYLDLESTCPPDFVEHITSRQSGTKIILSYHNFDETPSDLPALYSQMQQIPADLYKIAVFCKNSIDALRLLLFTKNCKKPICTMGMGEHGEVTRILGTICGSAITYSSISDSLQMVKGQLSAETLVKTYHFHDLTPQTNLYGLIGDPVSKSISDFTHNALFKALNIPAVYVKMPVSQDELQEFIPLSQQLGFKGMSVTMPLKERLLNCVQHISPDTQSIAAANTLSYHSDGIHAFNTDGIGALNAIEKLQIVKNKHILIIGAGGAAKAIIVESVRRGARVTVLNRTIERAQELAENYPIEVGCLDDIRIYIEKGYDILINTTPEPEPFNSDLLLTRRIVMDIKTVPVVTTLIERAIQKECSIVYGYEMFIEQALEQFALWFNGEISHQEAKNLLEHYVKQRLGLS
jgi:3-dehydroquinate dehydratase/shikimate dehydrogenase